MYFAHPDWVCNTPLLWLLTGRRPGYFERTSWSNLHLFPFQRERATSLALVGGPGLNNPAGLERFVSELEGRTPPSEDARFFLLAFASAAAPALGLSWYAGQPHAPGTELTLLSEVLPPGLQQPAPQPPLTDNGLPQRRTTNSEAQRRLALPLLRPGQGTALPSWNFTAPLPHNPFRLQRRAPPASQPAPLTPPAPPSPPSSALLPELRATTPRPRPTQGLPQPAPRPRPNTAPSDLPQPAPRPRPSTAPARPQALEHHDHPPNEHWPRVPTLACLNALLDTTLGLQADGTQKGPAKRQRTLAAWHAGLLSEAFDTLNAAMQNLLCTGTSEVSTPAPSGAAKRRKHN